MDMPAFLTTLDSLRPAHRQGQPVHITNRARSAATAMRILRYGKAMQWDCTLADIATALDLPAASVRAHCVGKGWLKHTRCGPITPDQHDPEVTSEAHDLTEIMAAA